MPFDFQGIPDWDLCGPGTWMGLDRSGPLHARDPEPTLEERQERCEQMGLVFCSCTLREGHVIVYNPACPVHQHYCRLP